MIYVPRMAALGMRLHAEVALIARASRDDEELAARLDSGAVLARELDDLERPRGAPRDPGPRAFIALARAELGRLRGTATVALWEEAADAFDEVGIAATVAYARLREAEAHLAGPRDRGLARDALRHAGSIAERLGARPLLDEIQALATRARLDLQGEPQPAATSRETLPAGLTARELEVLRLVALGRTNRQIATELFITEKTAGLHVSNILSKLGAANRSEAAAVAHRLALVPQEPATAEATT
jgi:DNA-binding CsgD family transcriptional regulator